MSTQALRDLIDAEYRKPLAECDMGLVDDLQRVIDRRELEAELQLATA